MPRRSWRGREEHAVYAGESILALLQGQGITSCLGQQTTYSLLFVQCNAIRQGAVTVGEQQLGHSAPERVILFKL